VLTAKDLDTQVTILQRAASQEAVYGTQRVAWVPLLPALWAQVRDVLPSRAERAAEGVTIARRPCRVRLRWRADLASLALAGMRLRIGTGPAQRELAIIAGPAELGRREGLELVAEELSTEGREA
jgi:head-tail adaptor